MSYNINTLFGDAPVPITRDPNFVVGSPSAKIWKVVVDRTRNDKSTQKDTTMGMGLTEAIEHANNIRGTYRADGFTEVEGGFLDPEKGDKILVYVV